LGEPITQTIALAVEEYLLDLEAQARFSSARSYRHALKPLLTLGVEHVAEVTPLHMRRLMGQLARRMKPSSLLTLYYTWSAFFSWAKESGLLMRSPLEGVPKPRAQRPAHRYLATGELRAMYAACQDDQDRLIMLLCGGAGLRVSELLALRWLDLDLEARAARIFGKGSKWRRVAISQAAADVLAAMPRVSDRPMSLTNKDSVRYRVRTLGRAAGLRQRPTTHMLRHSFAVAFLEASGEDAATLQALLGHTTAAMTAYYVRDVREAAALRKAMAVDVGGRIFG